MSSLIQIYNAALARVAASRVSDPDLEVDNARGVELCQDLYPIVKETTLAESAWSFASRKQKLDSIIAGDDDFNRGNRFLIPSDVIRVHRVFRTPQAPEWDQADWEREEQYIYVKLDVIYCHFIIDVSENKMPGYFVDAMSTRLAAEICMPITENPRLMRELWELYGAKITEAKSMDGSQGRSERTSPGSLNMARRR